MALVFGSGGERTGEIARGCCQSNGNLSPVDAAIAEKARRQAMRDCHSANAVERRSR